jgi:hypothetical protein
MSRSTRIFVALTALIAAVTPTAFARGGAASKPAVYLVGGGVQSINPTAGMLKNNDFYLGGYGFGNGKVAGQVDVLGQVAPGTIGDRYAKGILADGIHSRAIAFSDLKHTIVLGQIETQGYYIAYKQGPFGIAEIRQDAAAAIAKLAAGRKHAAPAPAATQILVDSNHTHGGPDTPGVWGGVPTSYLKLVHDRTVRAIVDAWSHMRKATLNYGVAHAGVEGETKQYPPTGDNDPLLTNQFRNDPNNQTMDDEIRVLQARDPSTGTVLDTWVSYSSHPTVLGSSNRFVTADYTGELNKKIEATYGGFGMQQVATLGREQPARDGCPTGGDQADPKVALCALDNYASRVLTKVKRAVAAAKPLTGNPVVGLNSYFLADVATTPVLSAAEYGGFLIGAPFARANTPPWFNGDVIGTSYFVGRIGDVLLMGSPGEIYAQIWQKVRSLVPGMRGYVSIGTAGDFLGYIIAPLEAYPEPIRRSLFDGDPPPAGNPDCGVPGFSLGCPDPVGNDNYLFNSSVSFGERLTCDLLRGAGDVLTGGATTYWSKYERCPLFATDLLLPPGADMQFPQQPDLSAVLTHQ